MKIDRQAIKKMFGGRCAYCGEPLGDEWHVDHVEPVKRQYGDIVKQADGSYRYESAAVMSVPERHKVENLFPSCVPCNIHKSASSVEGFRRVLQEHVSTLNKSNSYSIYRHAKRFGLVKETPKTIIFWFEKYNMEGGENEAAKGEDNE